MEFRLTYEGLLLGSNSGNTRAAHKHEIRRVFHNQLKKLWAVAPQLNDTGTLPPVLLGNRPGTQMPIPHTIEGLRSNFSMFDYAFVPLVTRQIELLCDVHILFLRPDVPGQLIRSGDLDNRLKTIFDALRLPHNKAELGGFDRPADDEQPFFCLLEDDSLITKATVETDTLLEPTSPNAGDNDARLIITVRLKPYSASIFNMMFG